MMRRITISFVLFLLSGLSVADEIRPGYLELKESSQNIFSVIWKVPAKGDKKLSLDALLPTNCKNKTQANTQLINGAYIRRWIAVCDGGLADKTISVSGLVSTNTDVLLRMEFLQTVLLSPHCLRLPGTRSRFLSRPQAGKLSVRIRGWVLPIFCLALTIFCLYSHYFSLSITCVDCYGPSLHSPSRIASHWPARH